MARPLPLLVFAGGVLLAAQPFRPYLRLDPPAATAAPGGTVAFRAEINYVPDGPRPLRQPGKWSVEEGAAGGTISRSGLYTAPASPGTYHVRAEREDYPGVGSRAKVVVR